MSGIRIGLPSLPNVSFVAHSSSSVRDDTTNDSLTHDMANKASPRNPMVNPVPVYISSKREILEVACRVAMKGLEWNGTPFPSSVTSMMSNPCPYMRTDNEMK